MSTTVTRRQLIAAAAGCGLGAAAARSRALGRVPIGGTLALRVPWPTTTLDPHDLFDPLAAFFADAIAEPVYGRDSKGRVYPTLADGMPRLEQGQTVVRLRAGLRSGAGKALGGRDLAWSVKRARSLGAAGLLAPLTPWVRSDPSDARLVRFGTIEPGMLALLLSSPLTALLPVGFSPAAPDGTGPLRARCATSALELTRNPYAARGPSFLDQVTIGAASDLSDSLRAFESGADDIGWLGLGFHAGRPGARLFDYGTVGWVVLVTGREADRFAAPGTAQQLANAVPAERLGLGLGPRDRLRSGAQWSGDPVALYFDRDSPQLAPIAEAVAVKLSRPGHELTPTGIERAQLRQRRLSGSYSLAIDVVRDPGAPPTGSFIALATAERAALGRDLATHLPRLSYDEPAHLLTTSLRIGVLGGLAARGGMADGVTLAAGRAGRGIDLGGSYRG